MDNPIHPPPPIPFDRIAGSGSGSGLKRNRIPLSCFPCRASKQKCDRARPCGQCLRKAHPDNCRYAPRPEKRAGGGARGQAKGMAARLEKLEGMVRTMIETQVGGSNDEASPESSGDAGSSGGVASEKGRSASLRTTTTLSFEREGEEEEEGGDGEQGRGEVVRVFQGERATNYVGATHIMAILEDIEEMKSYFDDPEEPEGDNVPPSYETFETATEMLLFSAGTFRSKEDLIKLLPDRAVADRLVLRYFGMHSPSLHLTHRPAFMRNYNGFWEDPSKAPINWIALLFMVLALGTFFSSHTAPEELLASGVDDAIARTKLYRSAAGWALVYGKYMNPGPMTLPPLMLFVESEFLLNRANQTNCYVLMGVVIRLLLKMGLHRDPTLMPSISPFEGEMRRRMWAFASVMDIIMSFHVGLPSMISSIESDTQMPRNLMDEDFDEDTVELPPARPDSQYTILSYAVPKCHLSRIFGQIAANLHRLTPPPYSTVLHLDALLQETMEKKVPPIMKLRPLGDCLTDSSAHIIQRYGLSCLFHKTRCVLHRRYLTDAVLQKEHEFSRRVCMQSALALLGHQIEVYEATQKGQMLESEAWFVSALALHDFLLAATIIYVVIQSPHFEEIEQSAGITTREQLIELLQRSHLVWLGFSRNQVEASKTAGLLEGMLRKLGAWQPTVRPVSLDKAMGPSLDTNMLPIESLSMTNQSNNSEFSSTGMASAISQPLGMNPSLSGLDSSWVAIENEIDWRTFEPMALQAQTGASPDKLPVFSMASWLEKNSEPMVDVDYSGSWGMGVNE